MDRVLADPTVDEVRGLPAVARTTVGPDMIDANDHVNVAHYLLLATAGVGTRWEQLGMGLAHIESSGATQFTAEYHLRYLSELLLGDRVTTHVRLLGRGERSVHAMAYVVDEGRDRLAFTAELIALQVSTATRRTVPFGPQERSLIDAAVAADEALPWPATTCGAMGVR
jgi:acyl-CoA thioester hydrolase